MKGPPGYDHVVGLNNRAGGDAKPSHSGPFFAAQFCECRYGTELRRAAYENFAHHEGEADDEDAQKINNHKGPAVVLICDVWKLPQVAKADGRSGGRQNEAYA